MIIIASASKNRSLDSVFQLLNWFRSAIEENDDKKKYDYAADDNRIAEIRVLNKQVAHRRYRDVFIIETQ